MRHHDRRPPGFPGRPLLVMSLPVLSCHVLSCPALLSGRDVSPAVILRKGGSPLIFLNGGADVHLSDVYAFGRLFSGVYVSRKYIHPAILPHAGICSGTRCNYLRTRCFWRCLTINCLQLAQVRRSMSLRRLKNRRFRKICLRMACKAVFAKPSVPRFLHRGRAASATDKLYHTRHFCHTCQFCHFSFSVISPFSTISPSRPTLPFTHDSS